MNKIIVPCGYMGNGSSVITDLVSEFEGYDAPNGTFEYVFLHCPDGVFDLEDKLLAGNNAVRSDEAIHSFEKRMDELYSRKYWWVANYKRNIGNAFQKITQDYIHSIIQFEQDNYWYMQERLNASRFIQTAFRMILRRLTGNKILLKRALEYETMHLSIPTGDEFYAASRKYLKDIFVCLGIEKKNLILDQLLLPHNLFRAHHYFDENMECFVVQKDPRDLYIINKYVWKKAANPVPYPMEVNQFCDYYSRVRTSERMVENSHIHRFCFEDLIYQYDESKQKIMDILEVTEQQHTRAFEKFNPEKSIHNTQLFHNPDYAEEVKIIEKKLGEYLYDFPYRHQANEKNSF